MPNPGSFEIVPVFVNGIRVGEKTVDYYHTATKRQRNDALMLRVSRGVESGRLSLGGELYIDGIIGGVYNPKRYYVSSEEVMLVCSWNRMQAEHEKRLRELEKDSKV